MGLISEWSLQDNRVGNNIISDVAGSDNGTWVAGDTAPSSVAGPNQDYPLALEFDGVADAVLSLDPQSTVFAGGGLQFTIKAWIKCDDPSQSSHEMIFETGGNSNGLSFYIFENNLYGVLAHSATPYFASVPFVDSNWHEVAYVRDGASLTVYNDGVAGTPGAAPATAALGNSAGAIGNLDGSVRPHEGSVLSSAFFAGCIAGVRVFNSVEPIASQVSTNRMRSHQQLLVPAGY